MSNDKTIAGPCTGPDFLVSPRTRLGRWRPFPEEKPEPNKDCRHLVVIVQADWHYIGIRPYHYEGGYWVGSRSDEDGHHAEYVYWFTPLLADDEQSPPVPNAAEQTPEIHNQFADARRLR